MNSYIIYVEDDEDDVLLMREAIGAMQGPDMMVFSNGAQLLQYLERTVCFPSLIILDINMPVLNGRETLRLLKQHPIFSGIPVVLFSTSGNSRERLFASIFKTELVVKPNNFAKLTQTVQHLLSLAVKA